MTQIIKNISGENLQKAFLTGFDHLSDRLKGQSDSTLLEIRKNAIASFETLGLPTRKTEAYKYTNITKALDKSFSPEDILHTKSEDKPSADTEKVIEDILPAIDANILVFINGNLSDEYSRIISPENEIVIKEISQAYQDQPELFTNYFAQHADFEADPFIALNTAYFEHGTFIQVPDQKVVEKPVLLYFFSDTTASKVVSHPRNLFLIGKNSQVNFVEYFHTIGEHPSYNNALTEIALDDHALATYCKIETESEKALHTGTTQVHQKASSHFSATTIALSGGMIRNNLNIALDAEGCETHMFGLTLLRNSDHVDNQTIADHKKPNSFSNELYKNILDDKSTGVFNGMIFVRPNAQKTNAFQSNMNILLTNDAEINTKPQLEIWADDVKCSHGATTGQLEQEQLFYLRSRGLSEDTARAMLLYAFAIDILENIKIPKLREQLDELISARLHKNF